MGTSDPSVTDRLGRGVEGHPPGGRAALDDQWAALNGRAGADGHGVSEPCHERTSLERQAVRTRRFLDIVLAVTILLVLAPLMVVAAVIIKLGSPGPVFYRQPRFGLRMRPFRMWKFRTMRSGASSGPHQRYIADLARLRAQNGNGLRKLTDDPRVTGIGRFLRKTSIDELPQLFNVLLGHMSLIGPRPALEYEIEHYAPHHFERFLVRPGLTGLWQVSGRNQLGLKEMLDLDVAYARHPTFMTDLRILVRTPRAALTNA